VKIRGSFVFLILACELLKKALSVGRGPSRLSLARAAKRLLISWQMDMRLAQMELNMAAFDAEGGAR